MQIEMQKPKRARLSRAVTWLWQCEDCGGMQTTQGSVLEVEAELLRKPLRVQCCYCGGDHEVEDDGDAAVGERERSGSPRDPLAAAETEAATAANESRSHEVTLAEAIATLTVDEAACSELLASEDGWLARYCRDGGPLRAVRTRRDALRLVLEAAKRIESYCQQHTGDLRCCRCWDL